MAVELLKVSSHTEPKKTAGAITSILRKDAEVEVQTIGAAALNQAIKAIIIARGFLTVLGIEINVRPSFAKVFIDGMEKTAIKLSVHRAES